MKRAYFFGDSFVYGNECRPGDSYYQLKTPEKLFTTILSNKWNCQECNYGFNGASNEIIIHQATKYLQYINEGDYYIIIPTSACRYNWVDEKTTYWHNFPPNTVIPIDNKSLMEIYDKRIKKEWYLQKFYHSIYISIISVAKRLGAKIFYDDSLCWFYEDNGRVAKSKFETIEQDTNGKIKDAHFSWNGHKQFADYITHQMI